MTQQKIQNNKKTILSTNYNLKPGRSKAFTLVELIVVITILAILGTIAFISLQGYSTSARDSTRVSDISSMRSSLELFQLDAGKYPLPTNGTDITYSGGVVWIQGTFGETVFANTDKLDKIPLDPVTDKEYTYSVTQTRNNFQLGGIMEGSDIAASSPLISGELREVFAATTEATAYITGNYNGLMTKSNSGELCNIFAIPSIITNDTAITDLTQIAASGSFVYRGQKNLPGSFKNSKFKYDGGFDFKPNNLVAYSDTGSCTQLTENTNSGTLARLNLLKGIQNVYTGSIVKNDGEIKNILALNIDTNNPSNEIKSYASIFVNNTLGSKIVATNNSNTNNSNTNNSNTSSSFYYGADGSSDFSQAFANTTVVSTGTPVWSNAITKCGTTSMYFNGTSSIKILNNAGIYSLGTGDFTIDFWYYRIGGDMIFNYGSYVPESIFAYYSHTYGVARYNQGSTIRQDSVYGGIISDNSWHHVAITRETGILKLYIDGIYKNQSVTFNGDYSTTYGINLGSGNYSLSPNYFFNGYIDQFRILKGQVVVDPVCH